MVYLSFLPKQDNCVVLAFKFLLLKRELVTLSKRNYDTMISIGLLSPLKRFGIV